MTFEKLNKDYIESMKSGNKVKKEVLRSVIGNIKKAAIDQKLSDDITESLVDEVLIKEQKIIQEMIDTCPKERIANLTEYKCYKAIIDEYVPKLITDESEIEEYINYIIDNYDVDISNMGAAMKTIMPHLKGKCDMKIANSVIRGMCF